MSNDNTDCGCGTTCATPTTETTERVAFRQPPYNVRESADSYDVEVFVPGVNCTGVEIALEDDLLSITAHRAGVTPASWRPLRREVLAADFQLKLRLNVAVDDAKIEATVADGVLHVRLPKAEAAKPRRIEVK